MNNEELILRGLEKLNNRLDTIDNRLDKIEIQLDENTLLIRSLIASAEVNK